MSIIITGPQGCGKTKHGAALAAHYGYKKVAEADELWPRQSLSKLLATLHGCARVKSANALILTNEALPSSRHVVQFADAIKYIKA